MLVRDLMQALGRLDPDTEVTILSHGAEHPDALETVREYDGQDSHPAFGGRRIAVPCALVVLSTERV